ncbi:MAG: 5-(carboxyamino)imidazole ribonucleotide synthase [Candidatus Sumerlaeaceae bacterium]|nr:5-(carboxyamino)imidazole ribonucleotide synthase [Candidatus Sumerlaeaceae bacterium]
MKRVGILGGGQLGRMLALAGLPLGLKFRFLDPNPEAPAGAVGELVVGRFDDPAVLDRFADGLDVATYEFENVPVESARRLAARVPVLPNPVALETAQDRLVEKTFFEKCGLPTAPFADVSDRDALAHAVARIGFPAVLKTRRLGYDGKGQAVVRDRAALEAAWAAMAPQPMILERFIRFDRELSIVAARGAGGQCVFYPLAENIHAGGILRESRAPAPALTEDVQEHAEARARAVMEKLDYTGVLAIEFFEHHGLLLANEFAPRVHNSGHWTIDGAFTSQFENHLRAILGLPLGPAAARCTAVMLNLIGSAPATQAILSAAPGARVHLYDKAPRPGRKIGHVTLLGASAGEAEHQAAAVRPMIEGAQ